MTTARPNPPAWRIERMQPEGWERVRAIRLRALTDTPDAFGMTFAEEAAQPPEHWRKRLARADVATFLATLGGADVGLAVGAPYEGPDGSAGLFSMWVAPGCRGRGVAAGLIDAVVAWARSARHPRLLLDVGDTNHPAVRLYARMGFTPTGVTGVLSPSRSHVREHQRELDLGLG